MQEKIKNLFEELRTNLPQKLGKDELVFDANNPPILEENEFETSQIAIRKGYHSYNDCYRIEQLHVSASPEYYQILGLTMMCAVFQNKEITIHLTNPHSFIKKIVVGYDYQNSVGLTEKPISFHHYADKILGKYPYYPYHSLASGYFPSVLLFSEKEFCNTEEDWAQRNILQFGYTAKQITNLADLFLNFGNPNNKQDELVFESHAGICNLQSMSVEISFWLPNSLGWFDAAFL